MRNQLASGVSEQMFNQMPNRLTMGLDEALGQPVLTNPWEKIAHPEAIERRRRNYSGAFQALGGELLGQAGTDPAKIAELAKESAMSARELTRLINIIRTPGHEGEAAGVRERVGRRFYGQQGKEGVPVGLRAQFLSPQQLQDINSQTEGEGKFAPQTQAIKAQEAQVAAINAKLDEYRKGYQLSFDEDLYAQADRKGFGRMQIERQRLQRFEQLRQGGAAENDPRFHIANEIARVQTEQLQPHVSGVMGVGSLHETIQNSLLNTDEAKGTRVACEAIRDSLKRMEQRGVKELGEETPPGAFTR